VNSYEHCQADSAGCEMAQFHPGHWGVHILQSAIQSSHDCAHSHQRCSGKPSTAVRFGPMQAATPSAFASLETGLSERDKGRHRPAFRCQKQKAAESGETFCFEAIYAAAFIPLCSLRASVDNPKSRQFRNSPRRKLNSPPRRMAKPER
jgi:hypothetical protein